MAMSHLQKIIIVSLDASGSYSRSKGEACLNIHFKIRIHRASVSNINVVFLYMPHTPGGVSNNIAHHSKHDSWYVCTICTQN